MAGRKLYGGSNSNMSIILQKERLPCSSGVLDSLWVQTSDPSSQGPKTLVNFENITGQDTSSRPFFPPIEKEENVEEDLDVCFHQPGKKRRLTTDQVHFLERSFEVENKLEPERKVQLAKELGLQPRQVAIWFQNRRARSKTKQLENDYGSLKSSYDKLKFDYENLLKENEGLKKEINTLKERFLSREKGKELKCEKNSPEAEDSPHNKEAIELNKNVGSENGSNAPLVVCKQEDVNSAKSDVFDSDSPHYTEANQSSFLEPEDSSHAFEPADHSDFSQDEEDNNLISKALLPFHFLPKVEDGCYEEPPESSCHFGFPVEDQTFCFWPC